MPAQHPGQLAGLHVTRVSHWRVVVLQTFPAAAQFAHAPPFEPHAVASTPVTHVVPSQQPPQFSGPHVGVPTQRPPGFCASHV